MDPLTAAATAATLGLTGGLAPGPLTALVLTQTLKHGTREGIKVSLAPVLTDGPLLFVSATAASWMHDSGTALGIIGLCGAIFLLWLGWEAWHTKALVIDELPAPPGSVWRAILTNLLNPHPYLFWMAVGGPLLAEAWQAGAMSTTCFVVGFFGALCGAKIALALVVGRARHLIQGPAYVRTLKALGLVMVIFAVLFAIDGVERLGL